MKTSIPSVAVITLAIILALLTDAQAVVPPPDGGYPGGNTAEGTQALLNLTSGISNTANGHQALYHNSIGSWDTATGYRALYSNIDGRENTANGFTALYSNTTGHENTATGYRALHQNTIGDFDTANGSQALFNNTTGDSNTAEGAYALFKNTIGGGNTANGVEALFSNTTGESNTANGSDALQRNSSGVANTGIGVSALYSNTTGSNNTALGVSAGINVTTANDVICIGAHVEGANVSNTAWIGNVYGVTTQSGTTAPVVVSDGGQLGTVASSQRFKKDISTMENVSEAILSLRPVTFHYRTDTKGVPQFGLIAEEVAKVNPALVLPDKEGKPYTVRYDAVNAMVLNEFLKAHRRMEDQDATIARQQKQIEALTAGLQKVSAQLEMSKPAAKVAKSDK
jgi:hypothetical protein